ncbi:MAG TPA: nuclease-related domain-containing protein [Dermatophilaceae bacterium]|nr:nuclease-related domain-containing protein [Dermatophilaceae bacterium]
MRKAGGSAEAAYAQMRTEWLRRKRRFFALVGLGLLAAAVVLNLLLVPLGGMWTWNAGLLTGILLALWMTARDSPPSAVENWLIGSWGEQRTERELRRLPPQWSVFHDIETEFGNIDHVVVGPGGVFVIDTKSWYGRTTVIGDVPQVEVPGRRRVDRRTAVAGQVKSLAVQTSSRVHKSTRIRVFVVPVVAIWGDMEQRAAGDSCHFIAGDHLVEWLTSRPISVADSRISQIADAVSAAWAVEPASG